MLEINRSPGHIQPRFHIPAFDAVPTTQPPLLARARRIADTFNLGDEDIRKCSTEFIRELSEFLAQCSYLGCVEAELYPTGLGLQQKTPSMCQIPTYVTQIASGSEKVR